MASATKLRQPRLRASCDGCFLAKVKCSKARPICSRCLACGIECRYSPSSRAGKPKADSSTHNHNHVPADFASLSPVTDDNSFVFTAHHPVPAGLYKIGPGWETPPASVDGAMSRTQSISSELALHGMDEGQTGTADCVATGMDIYPSTMPWTPPGDPSASAFPDNAHLATNCIPQSHSRSHSYDVSMSGTMAPWAASAAQDLFNYAPAQLQTSGGLTSSVFPSPSTTPNLRPNLRLKSASTGSIGTASSTSGSDCLPTACLLGPAPSPEQQRTISNLRQTLMSLRSKQRDRVARVDRAVGILQGLLEQDGLAREFKDKIEECVDVLGALDD